MLKAEGLKKEAEMGKIQTELGGLDHNSNLHEGRFPEKFLCFCGEFDISQPLIMFEYFGEKLIKFLDLQS